MTTYKPPCIVCGGEGCGTACNQPWVSPDTLNGTKFVAITVPAPTVCPHGVTHYGGIGGIGLNCSDCLLALHGRGWLAGIVAAIEADPALAESLRRVLEKKP